MATAIIYVFSGTGNTLKTAHMIRRSFESRGIATTVYSVEKPFADIPSPTEFDYIGFGYPVHAYNCPQIFLQFVSALSSVAGKNTFIFKTSGEPFRLNHASSYRLFKTLKKKGFDVVLEKHLLMPYNVLFRYKDSMVKQMMLYNDVLCDLLVTRLLNDDHDRLRYRLFYRILSVIFRIQWLAATLNGRLYTVNMKKCTMCMRCVRTCPTQNISLSDGKLKFDGNCTMCMRCVMNCPGDAVNPGMLHPFKVNGAYDFKRIVTDPNIPSDFICEHTKGYFRLFRKYYRKAEKEIHDAHKTI